jgi:dihydrofolate reductase
MPRNVVLQMHVTLDGFADSPTGFVPITDRSYWKELDSALAATGAARADTLLMGKGTYRQFVQFWPKVAADASAPKGWRDQGRHLTETSKVIFSKSLPKATWANSTIVRGDIAREIGRLKRGRGGNLLIPGGVAFPRSAIERDLVDEYLLSVVPVIVGKGSDRLFGPIARQRELRRGRTWTFRNGVVLNQFFPQRKAGRGGRLVPVAERVQRAVSTSS